MGNTQDKIQRTIMSLIRNSDSIKDPSHVSVDIKTEGFLFWKKNEIYVSGRVDLESEKNEIDSIVTAEAHGLKIVNNLRLQNR